MSLKREPDHIAQEFLIAFVKGEEKGFDFFFREYFSSLTLFAYQITHDENEAEDIVQNCFEKLWKKRESLSHIESVKSYMYTSVRYACINYLRTKGKSQIQSLSIPEIEDFSSDIESLVVTAETIRELYAVIELLPARMREVFKLYYLEGKSYTEIGQLLHTHPETVRNQRFKALKFIRKTFIPG